METKKRRKGGRTECGLQMEVNMIAVASLTDCLKSRLT